MLKCYSGSSSTSKLSACEQQRLWQVCTNAQTRLSIRYSTMRYLPKSYVLAQSEDLTITEGNISHCLFKPTLALTKYHKGIIQDMYIVLASDFCIG